MERTVMGETGRLPKEITELDSKFCRFVCGDGFWKTALSLTGRKWAWLGPAVGKRRFGGWIEARGWT